MKHVAAVSATIFSLSAALLAGCDGSRPVPDSQAEPELMVRREAGTGPVRFVTEVSAETITTLDALHYRLTLMIGPGYEADFPDLYPDEHLEGFIVTRRRDRQETSEDGTRRIIRDYELEPEFTGKLTLGPVHVYYYREDEISEEELVSEPLEITVVGEDLASDARQLRSVRGLVTVEEYQAQDREVWPWVLIATLGALALVGAGVWFVRRPRPGPPPLPPHEVAIQALRRLVNEGLIEQGQIESFFVRLSQIVREYIEAGFGVRAPEQTTEEFLQHAAEAPAIAAHRAALEPFLQVADEVKFARYRPDSAVIERAFNTARDFILQTSPAGGSQTVRRSAAAAPVEAE